MKWFNLSKNQKDKKIEIKSFLLVSAPEVKIRPRDLYKGKWNKYVYTNYKTENSLLFFSPYELQELKKRIISERSKPDCSFVCSMDIGVDELEETVSERREDIHKHILQVINSGEILSYLQGQKKQSEIEVLSIKEEFKGLTLPRTEVKT